MAKIKVTPWTSLTNWCFWTISVQYWTWFKCFIGLFAVKWNSFSTLFSKNAQVSEQKNNTPCQKCHFTNSQQNFSVNQETDQQKFVALWYQTCAKTVGKSDWIKFYILWYSISVFHCFAIPNYVKSVQWMGCPLSVNSQSYTKNCRIVLPIKINFSHIKTEWNFVKLQDYFNICAASKLFIIEYGNLANSDERF